ncbi:class I SAM-dependent methyltransferase [Halostagnicola bangensis]
MDVDEYFDETAAFYDAVYDESVDGDLEFYRDLAREADGPVLEVGCGTGRIYLELLRDGVDADGIDISSGMLEILRENAAEDELEPTVREVDVTAFEADREYALVIVPFRTFLHVIEIDDQLEALERIHDALAPGGRLVLNAFVPSFEVICEQYGTWEERTLEIEGGDVHVPNEDRNHQRGGTNRSYSDSGSRPIWRRTLPDGYTVEPGLAARI